MSLGPLQPPSTSTVFAANAPEQRFTPISVSCDEVNEGVVYSGHMYFPISDFYVGQKLRFVYGQNGYSEVDLCVIGVPAAAAAKVPEVPEVVAVPVAEVAYAEPEEEEAGSMAGRAESDDDEEEYDCDWHDHPLVFVSVSPYHNDMFGCNICEQTGHFSRGAWRCHRCNFDVHPGCVGK